MEAPPPKPGHWPVPPQEDQPIQDEKIWLDGCFDFFHHGHAGVILQARRLGEELFIGIHSDEEILEHKGPPVMSLSERVTAAEACRWVTKVVPAAPYVTSLPWISHYGCRYVVHGDDITTDSGGEDAYRFVKQAHRMKIVKRTPGISTTDLVGRMLLCTKSHFIPSLRLLVEGNEKSDAGSEELETPALVRERLLGYATDYSGLKPGVDVCFYNPSGVDTEHTSFIPFQTVKRSFAHERVVYVDGGFDLFSSGQIAFLRSVVEIEEDLSVKDGWRSTNAEHKRVKDYGIDFARSFVVVGLHSDGEINRWKGLNYPIMNIYERGLCILQCKYVDAVIFEAPIELSRSYLQSLPYGQPDVVYHGPTSFTPMTFDPFSEAKKLRIFTEVPPHDFQDVNAGHIVDRIMHSRHQFEERQRKKAAKSVVEKEARQQEIDLENSATSLS